MPLIKSSGKKKYYIHKKVLLVFKNNLSVNRGIEKHLKEFMRIANVDILHDYSLFELIKIRGKYDIIDAQTPTDFLKVLITQMFTKTKKVVTLHNVFLLEGKLRRVFLRILLKYFADHIFCVSKKVAKPLFKYVSKNKITVFTPWLDLKKYKPLNCKKIKNSFLYVGVLNKSKGFHVFLKESKKHPQNLYFVAGKGELEKLIDPKQKNLKYLGFLNEDELIKWYNKIEVVWLPVVYKHEGFNRCAMEALACGTKVKASKNIPCPLPKKGENPREFAEKMFSEKNIEKIISVYEKL